MGRILKALAPRVMSARTHAFIDYIHAGTNFMVGAMMRRNNRAASNAAFALGAGVLLMRCSPTILLVYFEFTNFKLMPGWIVA